MSLVDIFKRVVGAGSKIDLDGIDLEKIIKYLQAFGYIAQIINDHDLIGALAKFKKVFGLEQDADLIQIVQTMEMDRCGCPDNLEEEFENVIDRNKWAFTHLKYYIEDFVPGLDKNTQRAIYKEAAKDVSSICGLTFEEVSSSRNANLVMLTGVRNGLGSPGNVLAYAYLPSSSRHTSQLTTTFDRVDKWIADPQLQGILMKNVLEHESFGGHNVGLTHTSTPNCLMSPTYSRRIDKPQAEDIRRLVGLYGPPKGDKQPPPVVNPLTGEVTLSLYLGGVLRTIKVDNSNGQISITPGYRVSKID